MNRIKISYFRGAIAAAAIAATLGPITGCERPERTSAQPNPNESNGDQHLTILTWEEYFSLDQIRAFENEHGIKVRFEYFDNLDEMEALLRSRPSEFDLVLTSGTKLADLISLKLVQPIRKDLIPLFRNLDSRFLGLDDDPLNDYSLPYTWGPTLVAYRVDKIPDPEKSWKSLWDERYRGHVLMLEETFDAYSAALLALGHDLNSQDPAHLEEATKLLIDQVERLDARIVDINEIRDKLISGDCWITMTYSSDAAVLAEKEENISYFIPEEGASLWLDSFVIPRESKNIRNAHLFLDFFCRPEVAAANSNELWCASANKEVRHLISKEILEDGTIYLSDEVLERCHVEAKSSPDRQRLVNQGFKRLFDLVREAENSPTAGIISKTDEIETAQ